MKDWENLVSSVKRHEGYRRHVYLDTLGNRTIGYGTNLELGLSQREAGLLLQSRLFAAYDWLEGRYSWFAGLSEVRAYALTEMVYQLGPGGFTQFQKMIRALRAGKYDLAAAEALDSKWARQTPRRAEHVAKLLREG